MYHRQDQRYSVRTKKRTMQAFPSHSLLTVMDSIINAGEAGRFHLAAG